MICLQKKNQNLEHDLKLKQYQINQDKSKMFKINTRNLQQIRILYMLKPGSFFFSIGKIQFACTTLIDNPKQFIYAE